jgi:membrane-associated phospholipid phosphatase
VKKTAQVISVVFHPLLMTTYLFVVLSLYLPSLLLPARSSLWLIFLIFLMTFLLPSFNFLFFRFSGTIRDLSFGERKDRVLPFAFIAILYCVVTIMFYWKFPVPNLLKLMLIVTAMVIVSSLTTLFYKVSVHSVGVWGILGILVPLNQATDGMLLYPLTGGLVIAGAVMSARLLLNAHVPREVMIGGVMGFAIGFAGMLLLF